ncbi:hypothetical protein HMPREF1051_2681 [Neisseria sicca VK64]|uniref:Uncharacterized protein n=1 Tax=Neisseria sicca VK64 TaxID=1095748 RepID=I2NWD3_NEISI|nr:hypothetical protein HMPREF1051_2681 [Neisseria sicca VK64]
MYGNDGDLSSFDKSLSASSKQPNLQIKGRLKTELQYAVFRRPFVLPSSKQG